MREFREPGGSHQRTPAFEVVVSAIALPIPCLFVVATRVRAEKYAAGFECAMQFAKHTRQFLRWNVKERGIGEYAVEMLGWQVESEKILMPYLGARVPARHLDKTGRAIQAHCPVPKRNKGFKVAARPASEIQNDIRLGSFDVAQKGVDVLAHVVIVRAGPERLGVSVIVCKRQFADLTEFFFIHALLRQLAARALTVTFPV